MCIIIRFQPVYLLPSFTRIIHKDNVCNMGLLVTGKILYFNGKKEGGDRETDFASSPIRNHPEACMVVKD